MNLHDLPARTVITFQHVHSGSPKRYTYAAINSQNGWHLTARTGAMSADELAEFIGDEPVQVNGLAAGLAIE